MNKFRQISIIGWSTIGIPIVVVLIMIIAGINSSIRREKNNGLNVITQQDKKVELVEPISQPVLRVKETINTQVQQTNENLTRVPKIQPKKIDSFQKDQDTSRIDSQFVINKIDTSSIE